MKAIVTTVPRVDVGQISEAVREKTGAHPNAYPIANIQIATIAIHAAGYGLPDPERSATPR